MGPPAADRLYMVLATIALAEDNAHQKVARQVGFFESDDEAKVTEANELFIVVYICA